MPHELRSSGIPIQIIFLDREEAWIRLGHFRLGLLGSLYYALKSDLRNIRAVYNLEFCGMGE
ncbi:MAG: Zn-dependent exopeptidase M28, partial [Planctomycetes bacterium]|nr:Zn-dependent exopeptidase M28 [Planctomycetota bacterium]